MSRGKRNRRPGGHPARVAARREREASRTSRGARSPAAAARRIVRETETLSGPLEAELWASHLLGAMWEQRTRLPLDEVEDYALIYGRPLVEAISRTGGAGAWVALAAIAAVDDGELGLVARGLADRTSTPETVPAWGGCLGETTITAAAVMREDVFDDGFTVFLEARHATGDTHAIGVYVDHNLGGMAKDILLAGSIDQVAELVREHHDDESEVRLEPVKPADAAAEVHTAMALTEMTLNPPVSEEYPALRALAALRADEAPGAGRQLREQPEISTAERDALREEFLSSAEGRGFAADGDEAFTASLAIDFCADYVDGRPLRWSPVVVELFMAGWVPTKVLADGDLLAALPTALDAWVRFAGRKRSLPQSAIEITREAIVRWRDEMTSAATEVAGADPGKQLLMAAKQAGVDVGDPEALTSFVAGWNARSTAA